MEKIKTQLEIAAQWLNEAATVLVDDVYLHTNLKRVHDECLRLATANDNQNERKAA